MNIKHNIESTMRLHIKTILAGAALMASSAMQAQYTSSGYFTDGYLYRHELNPAFGSSQGYISMPVLGNLNLGLRGDLHMQNFIYNVNGRTTTFMNPNVSADEVLANVKDQNKLSLDLKMQLLSFGFKGLGGYNTFGLNVRTNMGVNLPGNLFRMAKEGLENKTYDLSGLDVQAKAYAEVALGHSHKINDNLTIGAKAKVLIGGAGVTAKLNQADLALNPNGYWDVTADAEIQASVKGLKFETEMADRETNPRKHVSGMDIDGAGINGLGVAFDLGAEYKINRDLSVSAAILDLGFINWKQTMLAKTYDNNKFTTSKYTFNVDDEATNNFEDEMDRLVDDLAALADLEDKGDIGKRKDGLDATMNLGVEYKLPVYRKLSFGLMNTTRFGDYSWTDFRLSANIAPVKVLSMGVNYSVGTYGSSFGWIFNLHPSGFNLFLAMDHTLGKVSKEFVPLHSNAHVNLGINFPF